MVGAVIVVVVQDYLLIRCTITVTAGRDSGGDVSHRGCQGRYGIEKRSQACENEEKRLE